MPDFNSSFEAKSLAKIGRLSDLCFNYDYFASALARIHRFHDVSKYAKKSRLMLFYGATRVGKTTIIDQFCKQIDEANTSENQTNHVISVQVPASCTPKALATELLVAFGDPAADKGTMPNMTRRVGHYLAEFNVSMVILDEFQHLIESKSETVLYNTAEWLKSIVNQASCPFLFCGMPTIENVIASNKQLSGRVKERISLPPLKFDTPEDQVRVQTLLGLFSKELMFENATVIASESFAKAILIASEGALGRIVNILELTCLNALREASCRLEKHHYEEAVAELAVEQSRERSRPTPFSII